VLGYKYRQFSDSRTKRWRSDKKEKIVPFSVTQRDPSPNPISLSFRARLAEKMNKFNSFYVILAFQEHQIEDFCVFLRSGLL